MAVLYLNKSVLTVGPADPEGTPPVVLINGQAEPPVLPSRTTPFSEEAGSLDRRFKAQHGNVRAAETPAPLWRGRFRLR
jgi:hypothetical protein